MQRTRPAWRTPRLLALLALATACASPAPTAPPDPADVPADMLRNRHAKVAIGHTQAEVAAAMGGLPVRRPGHPDAPFPTPFRVAEWETPSGEEVRLEVYVIATRPAEGCPDVLYDDAPVAYAGGRVVATTWEEVEWRWREWGGDLAGLRALQDRVGECEEPAAPFDTPPLDTP
jgi:hypothetical protein